MVTIINLKSKYYGQEKYSHNPSYRRTIRLAASSLYNRTQSTDTKGLSARLLFACILFLARDALAQYRDTQVRGRDLPYLVVYLFNAPFVRSRMGTIIDTE